MLARGRGGRVAQYLHRTAFVTMASTIDNPAVQILDKLISHVQHKLTFTAKDAQPSTNAQSSFLPTTTSDVAWRPIVPRGHTTYSWVGDDDSETPAATVQTTTLKTLEPPAAAAVTEQERAPAKAAAKAKPQQPKKEAKPVAAPALVSNQPDISRIDIRVGQVVKASRHPDAEKLYVEEIDIGEDKPRQVISGLVPFIPIEEFSKARLCVICNLKPSTLRGVQSFGMVLAASNADRSHVELIAPPADAPVGTRLTLTSSDIAQFSPDAVVDPKKKNNAWDAVKDGLKVDSKGRASFNGDVFRTAHGDCRAPTLKDAIIS